MMNFRKWIVVLRTGFRIFVVATPGLFGLISIQSSGLGEGLKLSSLPQPLTGSANAFQTEEHAQDSDGPQKPDKKPNISSLYHKHCQKCHSQDGTGADGRKVFPEIPDFTSKKWQKGRSNADLVSSIVDGKGTSMPPFANKLSNEEAKALAGFVRCFSSARIKPMAATDSDFQQQLEELFEQMKELRKQFHQLSKPPE